MTPETRLLVQIRNTLGRLPNVRLFRNNVGTLQDRNGQHVQYGLCVGSADLIGFVSLNGRAIFTAIEVKSKTGRVTPEQLNFLEAVRRAGGFAGVARSINDAEEICRGK